MIEINLLPKEYRKRSSLITFDKKLLYVGIGAAVLILAMGGTTIYQRYQLSSLDKLIVKARIEENRYRQDLELIDALTQVKSKILERLDAVEKLDRRRDFYVNMLEDLNHRIPEYVWMTSFGETSPQPAAEVDSAVAPETQTNVGHATIKGYAFSLNAIASFMIGLMKSEFFDNVQLGHTLQEPVLANVKAYNFELTCDLNYDATDVLEDLEDVPEEDFRLSPQTAAGQEFGWVF
jgi:Tfp pilus assembly protein PilN